HEKNIPLLLCSFLLESAFVFALPPDKCLELAENNIISGLEIVSCSLCRSGCEIECVGLANDKKTDSSLCFYNEIFTYESETCTCNSLSGKNAFTKCSWLKDLVEKNAEETILINEDSDAVEKLGFTSLESKGDQSKVTLGDIGKLEYQRRIYSDETFVRSIANALKEDSSLGKLTRLISGVKSPLTYNDPKTKEFFNKIGAINSNTEIETIKEVYETVTNAVPGYGEIGDNKLNHIDSTFEDMFTNKFAVCRDKASLLNVALRRKGINSEIVAGEGHMWVRVTLSEGESAGKEIDLDPTWYHDFVPLEKRGVQDPSYCNDY
ncbi:MAG: hypothetical protein WC595_06155, partial [Candidatus Nanoarchaeia archaeon]